MQHPVGNSREGFSQTLASLAPKPQPAHLLSISTQGQKSKVRWEWQYCRWGRAWEEACELYQLEGND